MKKDSENRYYVVRQKAVPEVLLKVVKAKRLLDSEKAMTIHEATALVGISRSSFYKYKDDIHPFHEDVTGKTLTFIVQMDDVPGQLSRVLQQIALSRASVLTIHQTVPINEIATLTLSVHVLDSSDDVSTMLSDIEALPGVHYLKILARE